MPTGTLHLASHAYFSIGTRGFLPVQADSNELEGNPCDTVAQALPSGACLKLMKFDSKILSGRENI